MRAFARWTCAALLAALSLPGLVAAQSSNANLATVAVDYATLEPAFDPAITQYTASSDGNEFVCLFPAVDDPGATFLIDGMSAGFVCLDTTTFPRTAIVSVTAEDGITTKDYHFDLVVPLGSNADIAYFGGSGWQISPDFAPAVTEYVARSTGAPTVCIYFGVEDFAATLTINGIPRDIFDTETCYDTVNLPATMTIVVTAEDGVTTKTTTVQVLPPLSTDSTLDDLQLSVGAFTSPPAFNPENYIHDITVPTDATAITFTATPGHPAQVLTYNGLPVGNDGIFGPIALAYGVTEVLLQVMPEDGISRRDYVLRVNRPLSSEARLSSLSTSLPGFPAAFDPEVQVYPVTVSGGTSSITVTATPMAAQATFTVQGVAGVAGVPSGEIPLAYGQNTVILMVTAQDGSMRGYALEIAREIPAAVAIQSFDVVDVCCAVPPDPAQTLFVVNGFSTTTRPALMVTTTDPAATMTLDGLPLTQGGPDVTPYLPPNQFVDRVLRVTSADGLQSLDYTVRFWRPRSSNAELSDLTPTVGEFTTTFQSDDFLYYLEVDVGTPVAFTLHRAHEGSAVEMLGFAPVADGVPTVAIPAALGDAFYNFNVVSEQGGLNTYTVRVRGLPSANANLTDLTASAGSLSPAFDPAVLSYTLSLPPAQASVDLSAITANAAATMTLNGQPLLSGEPATVTVPPEGTLVTVVVQAQAGNTATTSIAISRSNGAPSISGPTTLGMLEDGATQALELTLADVHTPPADLTIVGVTSSDESLIASAGVLAGMTRLADRVTLPIAPQPDAYGVASVSIEVQDAGGLSATHTIAVTVQPINDAPTFAITQSVVDVSGEAGSVTVPGVLGQISAGPANESTQALSFSVVAEDLGQTPAISSVGMAANGDLTLQRTGTPGRARLRVVLHDDGGTQNGGIDSSAERVITVWVGEAYDLSVRIDPGAHLGGHRTYEIVVENHGPSAVANGTLLIAPLNGLRSPGFTCTPGAGATCTAPPLSSPGTFAIHLLVGASLTVQLDATQDPFATGIEIHAGVAAPLDLPTINPADDTATLQEPVLPYGIFGGGFE